MARVEISKWDIASMFGLVYKGEDARDDNGGYSYYFMFKGKEHIITQDYYNCPDEEEAKEQMAERVIQAIVAGVMI